MYKCLNCNKNYKKKFNKELVNRFSNTYRFCNGDINKINTTLLIQSYGKDFQSA